MSGRWAALILGLLTLAPAVEPVLWYDAPAMTWLDALPVGNGHIGAMVFGRPAQERIALDEATVWSGERWDGPTDRGGRDLRERIQKAFLAGDLATGHGLCAGFDQTAEAKQRIGTHLPVGDLLVEDPQPLTSRRYRRSLDLIHGVVQAGWQQDGGAVRQEVFCSNPDKVLVLRWSADQGLQRRITLNPWQGDKTLARPVVAVEDGDLVQRGRALERIHSNGTVGVQVAVRVRIQADGGTVTTDGTTVVVTGARALTLLVAIATDFDGLDHEREVRQRLDAAAAKGFDRLRSDHQADVTPRMARVAMDLGGDPAKEALPTNQRLARFVDGEADPGLQMLFFQLGRYLTLAGSREDSRLPLPLQGLWPDGKAATMGWSDDYHLDINTQQNYWMAEVGNLAESHRPLFTWLGRLAESGRRSARDTWGADGWCAHVTANAWGASPFNHGGAPTMGAWIASHLWEHYRFGQDAAFLRDTAYPLLRDQARFFLDTLVPDSRGRLVTCPAYSPENHFPDPRTGEKRVYSAGNLGDAQILESLFSSVIEGSRILGIDADLRERLVAARSALPRSGDAIHADGRLMEWLDPAYDGDYARSHRHSHHLLGVFPFTAITADASPTLVAAVRATLEDKRTRIGREDTEWTRANYALVHARLRDGDQAERQIRRLISRWCPGRNLLSVSWSDIFCLDGNTAGAAAIAEMLVQSHGPAVEVLPALPTAWPTGSFRGLRARGDRTVDARWVAGRPVTVNIHTSTDLPISCSIGGTAVVLTPHRTADGGWVATWSAP